MAIPSKPVKLVKFQWDLTKLPVLVPEAPRPYILRAASDEELEDAQRVVRASYCLDPEWSGCDRYIEDKVIPGVVEAFTEDGDCLFVMHGNRIIGASAFLPAPEADQAHLVTGPCVLTEYRSRGIGSALLAATLQALRERGASEAVVFTRPKSPAAKFLLPKFGGQEIAPPPAEPVREEQVAA